MQVDALFPDITRFSHLSPLRAADFASHKSTRAFPPELRDCDDNRTTKHVPRPKRQFEAGCSAVRNAVPYYNELTSPAVVLMVKSSCLTWGL